MSIDEKIKAVICDKISRCRVPDHLVPEEVTVKIEYPNTIIVLRVDQDEIEKYKGEK